MSDEELAEKLKSIQRPERQESGWRVALKTYTEEERGTRRAAKLTDQLLGKVERAGLKPSGVVGSLFDSRHPRCDTCSSSRIRREIAPDEVTAAKQSRVTEWGARIQAGRLRAGGSRPFPRV